MTTQTQILSHVTLESLENYRTAATQAVAAYRVGGHRLVRVVNGALKQRVYSRTAKLAPRTTGHMTAIQANVAKIVVKGIDRVAERAERVIERSSATAAAQVNKVADFAAGVDNEIVSDGLQAAARLTMPGARFALVMSSRVVKRANALAGAVGAPPAKKVARRTAAASKRKAAPVARRAKASVKAATKRTAKAVKTAQLPVAKAPRAARGSKKVEAAASAA